MPWFMNSLFGQAAAPQAAAGIPWYVNLLIAVGTIALSFFLGGYLGKKLRMYDHGWKIGLSLFTLLASAVILLMGPPLKLGIDLSGGALLVYQIDQSQVKQGETPDMGKLIAAVSRRVNPGGQKETTVRQYGAGQIEIILPETQPEEVKRIERIIGTTGQLEFRILANTRDNKELIERAQADPSKVRIEEGGQVVAWWVPVNAQHEQSFGGYSEARRTRMVGGRQITEMLVLKDNYDVTGQYLTRSTSGADEKGKPCVHFNFNSAGGRLFGELTGEHLPDKMTGFSYKLGIILDGELYSAPGLQSQISDSGQITGDFTKQQVEELVSVLNAGSLPAALIKTPVSELISGPTLGADTIEKSTRAMIIAAILVPLFMLWYYRFSGLVADIVLVLNMMMLFAIMLTIHAAFTLTGFAGLALTVGMAVDNNVLVYERLREEIERGATLRMAIRNAFQRASAVIIDANLTTLVAATVMYMLGSDQVKGFAVTLWLGVAISIYTSVFVARVIFDVAEKRGWLTEAKMLRLIGHTNIDFMRLFPYTATLSVLITVMAIGVSVYRGASLFDIDFTGGVSVQALFSKPQETAQVRELLTGKLPDLAISDVQLANEDKGLRFVVNTSDASMDNVRTVLTQVFGDKLAHNKADFAAPKLIEAKAESAPAQPAETKPAEPPVKAQSRTDLPSDSVLAMADEQPAAAAADKPTASAADKAASESDAAKTISEKPTAPAGAAVPAAPITAKEPSEPKSPPTEKSSPLQPASEKQVQSAAAPAPVAESFAGGSESKLTFATPVNHQAAEDIVKTAMEQLKLVVENVPFTLSNDKYQEGDKTAYTAWDLKIMLSPEKATELLTTLAQQVSTRPEFPASSNIGPAVAGGTRTQAIYALIASWICMIIYLWIRFQGVAFGFAAVVALIHDVFVMLGAIAISIYLAPFLGFLLIEPFKINLPIVAAFLTIIGYSVNDTIVVFDRIREVRGKSPDLTRQMVNDSTNQTLSRTLLTSFTVFLVVVILYLFGGEAVHGFAFALIVGVATGTFSSIYVAAPILLWLVGKRQKAAE